MQLNIVAILAIACYSASMGKKEKLIAKLKTIPKDFTFDDAEILLGYFGFYKSNKGRTSGSRVMFSSDKCDSRLLLHMPHPQKELREYQIKQLIEFLKQEGFI